MTFKLPVKYIFLFSVTAVILSACGTARQTSLFTAPTDIVTDTITQVYVVNNQGTDDVYKIKVGDRIVIQNLRDKFYTGKAQTTTPENAIQSLQVDSSGNLYLPSGHKFMIGGLNRKQAITRLQDFFDNVLKVEAVIDVRIVNFKVTLFGEFARQGNFLLEREDVSLIDILGEAGGLTKEADPRTCRIIRGDRQNPEIIYVNLNDYRSLGSKKLTLQNNDLITVEQLKSYRNTAKLQTVSNYVQPILVLLNLGLLILTIAK